MAVTHERGRDIALRHADRNGAGGGQGWALKAAAVMQALLHGLAAAGGWVLFVYWWRKVLTFTRQEDAGFVILFIALTVAVTSFITLVWVRHNIGIYRRKGPRKRLPEVAEEMDKDALGQPLRHPGSDALRTARIIRVAAGGGEKVMAPDGEN